MHLATCQRVGSETVQSYSETHSHCLLIRPLGDPFYGFCFVSIVPCRLQLTRLRLILDAKSHPRQCHLQMLGVHFSTSNSFRVNAYLNGDCTAENESHPNFTNFRCLQCNNVQHVSKNFKPFPQAFHLILTSTYLYNHVTAVVRFKAKY